MNGWKQWTLRVGFSIAMILFGYLLGSYNWRHSSSAVVHAQAAVTQVTVPKAWGPLIGTMNGVLMFQDRSGVIRLVAADTGILAEYITRQ